MRFLIFFCAITIFFSSNVSTGAEATEEELRNNLDSLVKDLGNDSFDVREHASAALSNYTEEYIKKFLTMAKTEIDPEISWRLKLCAKAIFDKKVGIKKDAWLVYHGSLGVEGSYEVFYGENGKKLSYFVLNYVDSDGACKELQQWDIITTIKKTEINNTSKEEDISNGITTNIRADAEYEITFRRYKNKTPISDQNTIDNKDNDFETITVKIKAGWKDSKAVDAGIEGGILENLWWEYLEQIKEKKKGD